MAQRRLLSLWFANPPNPTSPSAPGAPLSAKPSDAELDEALRRLALWCQHVSPLTAPQPPDGILIDITGCAHLFGGEAGLKARLARRLPNARIAIAGTAAAAWGLARYGEAGSEDIAVLPVAALNLDPRIVIRLRRVGIRRIGELARLPRAELTAGFGQGPVLRLAQALGRAPEAIRFITAPPNWQEIEHHAEPIAAPAQLLAALARLTETLCVRLAAACRGATSLTARFHRIDAVCPEIVLGFAAPCRDAAQIGRLLKEKLAEIDPGFGVEAISLTAVTTEPLAPAQRGMTEEAPDYARPIDTLLNRLGGARFWRAAPQASHIPEFAARRAAITAPPARWEKPRQPRPLRLLSRPDAIAAIAPLPDDPPVQFSWRGKTHRIAHATGPERIAREWWRHQQDGVRPEHEHLRDYYAVEDTEGARFWVFRAGLHQGAAPARWFLHGLFG